MESINFEKAKKIYNIFSEKREKKQELSKKKLSNYPFLILSNLYDRDFGSSEYCIHETLFNIGFEGYDLDDRFTLTLSNDFKSTIIIGRLFNKKISKKINLNFFKFFKYFIGKITFNIIRVLISCVDSILIFIYSFIYLLFFRPFLRIESISKVNEIYTFTYIKSKADRSISYCYPDFYTRNSKFALITNFYEYKLLLNGIFQTQFKKNIINPINFISLNDLCLSIYQLIFVYTWDLISLKDFSYGKFLSFLNSLKYINRKFYYLICSKSLNYILKSNPKYFYIWSENQLHSKSISFFLSLKIQSSNNLSTKIISYIGYPFFSDFHPHLEPSSFELNNFIWGSNNFMFCNQESISEFQSSIQKKNFNNFQTLIARNGLNRYSHIKPKLKNKSKENKMREITFFSHSSIDDFINMIKCFEFYKNKLNFRTKKVFIRLHPTLPLAKVKSLIDSLENIDIHNFEFINSKLEDINQSIEKTEYCIFADSNSINTALRLNAKVIAFKISFLFNPPIYTVNKEHQNLNIL